MASNRNVILFVEDDPADARLIEHAFQKAGVTTAMVRLWNGDAAVDYLSGSGAYADREAHPLPSIALLDIKLPRRTGLEVLMWIREQQGPIRRLPVVMLTSSTETRDVNRAYELGANSYLRKPDSADQLFNLAEAFRRYWLRLNESPEVAA
jgi:CheY-like chemotaxis protein